MNNRQVYKSKFSELPYGAFLQCDSDKHTNVFMKIPERVNGLKCKCDHDWNAANLSDIHGVFLVHFCPDTIVRWDIHAVSSQLPYYNIKGLIEDEQN